MKRLRKPRTPAELSRKKTHKAYSLYLKIENIDYLQKEADKHGAALSVLIDEAIESYIAEIRGDSHD